MRVDYCADRNETRDAIDMAWYSVFAKVNLNPVLVPNDPEIAANVLRKASVDGILLSGGNDICAYGKGYAKRDETESLLLDYATQYQKPVLGICRGMQMLLHYFNEKLTPIDNHVGVNHVVCRSGVGKFSNILPETLSVNSFHRFGVREVSRQFIASALCMDNSIEAIEHTKYPFCGVMWHPEREPLRDGLNEQILKQVFKIG